MLHEQIVRLASQNPEAPALAFGEQSCTYTSLMQAASRLRSSLSNIGIGKGDSVAVMLPN
jgi:non-ribosomal peptide synthetase component E (peptide arylation enzyme)